MCHRSAYLASEFQSSRSRSIRHPRRCSRSRRDRGHNPLHLVAPSMPERESRLPPIVITELSGERLTTTATLETSRWPGTNNASIRDLNQISMVSNYRNKRLKRELVLAVFAAICADPVSRTYCVCKRDQGKNATAKPLAPRPTTNPACPARLLKTLAATSDQTSSSRPNKRLTDTPIL